MNQERFWEIIESAKNKGGSDIERRTDSLAEILSETSPEEIVEFSIRFSEQLDRAYSWRLWGAAYLIMGGCGDDSFWDFRSALISLGKTQFEAVITNPDSLADLDENEIANLEFEGFQYVDQTVYEELTGNDFPELVVSSIDEPVENEWDFDDENEMKERFPNLFSKYGG